MVAGVRRDLGQFDAAILGLERAAYGPPRPWSARIYYAYADALVAKGDLEAARRWFAMASAMDSELETDAAFAPLPKLLSLAERFSTDKTIWLLPKGRNAVNELEQASKAWDLDFSVQPSVTDPDAGILVGTVRGARAKTGLAKGRQKR